jgi:hypothetical protein
MSKLNPSLLTFQVHQLIEQPKSYHAPLLCPKKSARRCQFLSFTFGVSMNDSGVNLSWKFREGERFHVSCRFIVSTIVLTFLADLVRHCLVFEVGISTNPTCVDENRVTIVVEKTWQEVRLPADQCVDSASDTCDCTTTCDGKDKSWATLKDKNRKMRDCCCEWINPEHNHSSSVCVRAGWSVHDFDFIVF